MHRHGRDRGHDTRSVPAPARRASLFQFAFITYLVICGGAYGLEEAVSSSGPGLVLLLLIVLPFVYGLPLALVCAELTSRFPVEGGYYQWVRLAYGDAMGYVTGWLAWLAMFATNASFAVLFRSYLQDFFFASSGPPVARWATAAAVVWVAVFLNYRGIALVGTVSVLFTVIILIPFALMTGLGLWQWRFNPIEPFVNPDRSFAAALVEAVLFTMWLYGGFEKVTVNAGEVEDPVHTFPRVLAIVVPLCAASYLLPTLAALAALGEWRAWQASYFLVAAARLGGPALATTLTVGALVSNLGLLTTTILSQSRLPMVLADDGLFPRVFGQRHARFGTPVASLLVTGLVLSGLCAVPFTRLVAAAALVQSLLYLLIYAAFFRLRRRADHGTPVGFSIPLRGPGLAAMIAPSVLLVVLVIEQGLFANGTLHVPQALLGLLLVGSGPATYFIVRYSKRS